MRKLFFILLVLGLPFRALAFSKGLVSRLESAVPRLMTEGGVPGLSIALVKGSEVLWNRGFGVRNALTGERVDADTVFQAASLSKPVFAYAVLKLVEQGKLDLDVPLTKYLPAPHVQNDDRVNLITARIVLSHRTGFPNWRPEGKPLMIHFTPGEKFSYSGEGYVYLQKVVEHLTGQPLNDFMTQTVFKPLGMKESSYVWQERWDAPLAVGHDEAGRARQKVKLLEANAASSLHITSGDFGRFLAAVMTGRGFRPATIGQMLARQSRIDEDCFDCIGRQPTRLSESLFWGLGWGLQRTRQGESFWHWGDNGRYKFQCYTVANLKRKEGVVIFTNSANGLSIIPEIVSQALGGEQPAFAWLRYESYDSPALKLFRAILKMGAEAALQQDRAAREAKPGAESLNERQMNGLGYRLLGIGRANDALALFKLNVELHSTSFNVYDSLGEAYMWSGNKELAIQNYERSLQLNPENANARERLKKLRGN